MTRPRTAAALSVAAAPPARRPRVGQCRPPPSPRRLTRHSVRRHLRVEIEAYDEAIRRFVPGYEAMLAVAAREAARCRPRRVLDLGAGTGALSEAVLLAAEPEEMILLDADAEMLAQARARLSRFGGRITEREGTFDDPLPPCDAVVASLALHHVPTIEAKAALFRRIADRLPPGGVLVNADVTMPSDPAARDAEYRGWAAHLASSGISREQAYRHFAEWAEEDTYLPREAERDALRAAGFEVAWPWTSGPILVAAATKPAATADHRSEPAGPA